MKLLANWREVLRHAWSIRLTLFAALLDSIGFAWDFIREAAPFLQAYAGIDQSVFFAFSLVSAVAAFVARLIEQKTIGRQAQW